MGKINLGRVFLGGIAAGIFMVVGQYIAFVLGAYRKLGEALPAGGHTSFAAKVAMLALVVLGGPLAIWLYAAIRPRFGAGPRTATLAAVYIWLLMMPWGYTVLALGGLLVKLPLGVMIALDIVPLPLSVAGMLIGAWVYKEEGSAAAASAKAG